MENGEHKNIQASESSAADTSCAVSTDSGDNIQDTSPDHSIPSLDLELQEKLAGSMEAACKETEEFRRFSRLFDECRGEYERFLGEASELGARAAEIVASRKLPEEIAAAEQVAKTLKNSGAGVSLVLKMMGKLSERLPKLDQSGLPSEDGLKKPEVSLVIQSQGSDADSYFKEIALHNYGLVTTVRNRAEDARDSFLSFFKNHVFVILDGIIDGQRHFIGQKENILADHPQLKDDIEKWYSVYEVLIDECNNLLFKFNITAISPVERDNVDYLIHEPFETVEDQGFDNETVHELVRLGYRYEGKLLEDSARVIRPAQVVVVKNKGVV